jgi:dTMP kinase
MIIEVEGIDGVGKTSQCRLLKNWLEEKLGERAIIVKDLESTQLGRQIKGILVTDVPRSKEVELFGFLCCKAHLFAEIIEKELEAGTHIICDRGIGSFLSYFEVLGFDRSFLENVLLTAVPSGYSPQTLLLDADVHVAMQRNVSKSAHSKFDSMGGDFFERQRKIYLDLALSRQWSVVSSEQPLELVHMSVINSIERMFSI